MEAHSEGNSNEKQLSSSPAAKQQFVDKKIDHGVGMDTGTD
jgi:hypothetical protein